MQYEVAYPAQQQYYEDYYQQQQHQQQQEHPVAEGRQGLGEGGGGALLSLFMETVLPMALKMMEGSGGPAGLISSLLGGLAGGGGGGGGAGEMAKRIFSSSP